MSKDCPKCNYYDLNTQVQIENCLNACSCPAPPPDNNCPTDPNAQAEQCQIDKCKLHGYASFDSLGWFDSNFTGKKCSTNAVNYK